MADGMRRKSDDERFVELGTRLPRQPRMDLYTRARDAGITLAEYTREVLLAHLEGPPLNLQGGRKQTAPQPAVKQPAKKKAKSTRRKKGGTPTARKPVREAEKADPSPAEGGSAIPFPDDA